MSDYVFVSAFYPLCAANRFEQIVHNYQIVSRFFHIHLFCPPGITQEFTNTTIHEVPFEELATYKLLSDATGLPSVRNYDKDTMNYMILMNAKTEFLQRIRKMGIEASHYIWMDAGIGKIFKDPALTFQALKARLASAFNTLPPDHILLPGCYSEPETNYDALISRVCWRFCGGFFTVPASLVDTFATTVLSGCEEIKWRSGHAVWEVNVWAFVEARLPIQWARGDHNETIFNCIN